MGVLSADTPPEIERVQMEILRRQGPEGRVRLLRDAILASHALCRLGIDPLERWLGHPCPFEFEGDFSLMEPLATPLLIIRVLDRMKIPYVVAGSFASSIHGEPRSTRDCDLLVALQAEHLEPLAAAVKEDFYYSSTAMEEALSNFYIHDQRAAPFNLIHLTTGFKVDLFVSPGRPFDQERLTRGVAVEIQGQRVRLSTAEDTILAKLEWYTQSPTDQQWRDVLGILLVQRGNLDLGYLKLWSRELNLETELNRAFQEADSLT